uniref:MARVEL domain-containing protein n=1 Tax=Salarias fasciatus TaxID=181472 RepID=A0A672GC42_SALFA
MGDMEAPSSPPRPRQSVLLSVLPSREFSTSRKGMLLIAEVVLSFISFVCFAASTAAAFVTVPALEFLAAVFLLFAYSTKFNERFKGFCWPLMDFMRCVTASIIFFIISIMAVSKYADGSSKAAGVKFTLQDLLSMSFLLQIILQIQQLAQRTAHALSPQIFGFIATIAFALDFYLIFNELASFLKQGGETNEELSRQQGNGMTQ